MWRWVLGGGKGPETGECQGQEGATQLQAQSRSAFLMLITGRAPTLGPSWQSVGPELPHPRHHRVLTVAAEPARAPMTFAQYGDFLHATVSPRHCGEVGSWVLRVARGLSLCCGQSGQDPHLPQVRKHADHQGLLYGPASSHTLPWAPQWETAAPWGLHRVGAAGL